MTRRFFIIYLLTFMVSGVGLAQQLPPLVAQQGYADLEKDFFTIPIEEIRGGIPVVLTGLSGEIVYDQDQLAGGN